MKSSTIHARINSDLKQNAEQILHELGLSSSEAVRLFYRQIELQNGLPFDIKIPNKLTKETIEKSENGQELNFAEDIDDLMVQLNAQD